MYTLINNNIDTLLREINRKSHVLPYIELSNSFRQGDYNTNAFQRQYRDFYQLNAARLSDDFCSAYFNLLNRANREISVEEIINALYFIQSNAKGIHAVHFSFATKLIHTLDNNLPIYDRMVATFYFLPDIKQNWTKEKKIEVYLNSYKFLKSEYERVIDNNLLEISIDKFRKKFDVDDKQYSNCKVIDTLIWRYTALLKSGAICNRHIQYR